MDRIFWTSARLFGGSSVKLCVYPPMPVVSFLWQCNSVLLFSLLVLSYCIFLFVCEWFCCFGFPWFSRFVYLIRSKVSSCSNPKNLKMTWNLPCKRQVGSAKLKLLDRVVGFSSYLYIWTVFCTESLHFVANTNTVTFILEILNRKWNIYDS